METLYQDVTTAVRALRRRPLFTVVVLFCLALGLGATTAILFRYLSKGRCLAI